MKKQSKWLLIGSLMCLGSVFQASYGMFNDDEIIEDLDNFRELVLVDKEEKDLFLDNDSLSSIMTFLTPRDIVKFGETCKDIKKVSNKEYLWEQQAIEIGASQVELKKVKNGFYTYKDIVIGHECWNNFSKVKYYEDFTDEKKLEPLRKCAGNGSEEAIGHLLGAYLYGSYGFQRNDPNVQKEGLMLAKEYADLGSEVAIRMLLDAYNHGFYGLQPNKPEALRLAKEYADKGSEVAIEELLDAYLNGSYGLKPNNPNVQKKGLEFAEYYAGKGSEKAIETFLWAYYYGEFGLHRNAQEGLVLAKKYADKGSQVAKDFINNHG